MPDTVIGPCRFCGRTTRCAPAMLGTPWWAVYCQHCGVTVTFWQDRYPTIEAVMAFWNASPAQGELFAKAQR